MRVMLADLLNWITSLDPAWIFMIFPLMFGSVAFSMWRDDRRQQKLESNPIHMTDTEYKRFNNKRFKK